jgi:hypothetical protein
MALTTAQLATLKTFVAGSAIPAIVAARNAGATYDLMRALNADTSPVVKGWRFLDKATIFRVLDTSELDNITTASKRETFWALLTHLGGLDCSVATGPKIVTDLFPNASAPNSRLALIGAAQQNVSVAEQALGCTPLATATPPAAQTAMVCNWVGEVTQEECQKMLA